MPSIKHLILFVAVTLCLSHSLSIQANEVHSEAQQIVNQNAIEITAMTLAVEDSWPPYANAYGEGISTDIITQALEAVGVQLTLKVYPYARVLDEISKGLVAGGYNVTRQKSSEKRFIFGDQAILTATASFYYPANNVTAPSYTSLADIPDDASIGIIADYEYGDLYELHKHRFREIKVLQQSQIINMLMLGRIDGAIMFDTVANHTLKTMNLAEDAISKGFLNHTSDVYVAFSKAHKDSKALANILDQGLLKIKNNGQYSQIINRAL